MNKIILTVAFAALLTSVSHVQAQQPGVQAVAAPQFNPDSVRARDDARIAVVKSDLKLTPDQEKKWPEAEAAIKRYNAARLDNVLKMRNQRPLSDPIAAYDERIENISLMANSMRALSTALKPLYATLNEEQRRKLMSVAGFAQKPSAPQQSSSPKGPASAPASK